MTAGEAGERLSNGLGGGGSPGAQGVDDLVPPGQANLRCGGRTRDPRRTSQLQIEPVKGEDVGPRPLVGDEAGSEPPVGILPTQRSLKPVLLTQGPLSSRLTRQTP